MRRLAALVTACAFVILAAGCASTPPSRFYTLERGPAPPRRHPTFRWPWAR